MRRFARAAGALLAVVALSGAAEPMDPKNPTCPLSPSWSNYPEMRFTPKVQNGVRILMGEGRVDSALLTRLADAVEAHKPQEIWLRSSGGDANVGNEAGLFIRGLGIPTRIPSGWTCFSACNFIFMGGAVRHVDPGGHFMVHMFTHLSDGGAVRSELARGGRDALELVGDVEQGSAMLASQDNDFLIRMGISRKLLTEVMYRQKAIEGTGDDKSTRRCLTSEEMLRYRVVNPPRPG